MTVGRQALCQGRWAVTAPRACSVLWRGDSSPQMDAFDDLFSAIRKSCSTNQWSRAVELVRAAAVSGVSQTEEEVVCRVRSPKHVVAPTVTLYPEDEEWDCTCEGKAPCCEHVAAAAIAARKAAQSGEALPTGTESAGALLYRFRADRGHLWMERWVTRGGSPPERLTTRVATAVSSAGDRRRLTPTAGDLAIDRLMGAKLHGALSGATLQGVLKALSDADVPGRVELDGKPVGISAQSLAPVAYVRDGAGGIEVSIEASPRIERLVVPGIAEVGGTLHCLSHTEVSGTSLEKLPSRRSFAKKEWATLVTEVLPELCRQFKVEIETRKLPETDRSLKPRVALEVEQVGGTLSVLPLLLYGDGARVDRGELTLVDGPVPVRNKEAEARELKFLHQRLGLVPGRRIVVSGDAATALASKLDNFKGPILGRKPGAFIRREGLEPRLSYDAGQVSIHFDAADGQALASGQAVAAAWQNGESLVPLLEGGWAPLPSEWLSQHGHRVMELLSLKPEPGTGSLPKHALPAVAAAFQDLNQPLPESLAKWKPLVEGFEGLREARRPSDLAAQLRDYQRQGINWLSFLRDSGLGATLADDMGLGKTLQALAVFNGRTLVVAPRSVLENWQRESARFRPGLRCSVYHGPDRKLDSASDLVLTTYAILRLDQDLLAGQTWDAVVLDEAQTIKNPDSQVTRAAYRLRADFKLTLSGTPVENRLEELWSQFQFTNPGLLGSRQFFADQYATPIGDGQPHAAAALRAKVRPFLLRRLKQDVARELPVRTDLQRRCDLSEPERAVYDTIRAATQKEVVEQLQAGGSVLKALEALLRLRQAACHSALVPGQAAAESSKTRELIAALDQTATDGHKSLVFSQWTSFLDLLEPHLREAGYRFVRLDGSTQNRQAVVDQFQDPAGPEVLLLSLKAGGTGLNLTAADHVFLMDPWWNPAVEDQAADRAHRIGQNRPVFVHRMVARDTVEERIVELQSQKRALADAALGEADRAASLTRDDLMSLLQ